VTSNAIYAQRVEKDSTTRLTSSDTLERIPVDLLLCKTISLIVRQPNYTGWPKKVSHYD